MIDVIEGMDKAQNALSSMSFVPPFGVWDEWKYNGIIAIASVVMIMII